MTVAEYVETLEHAQMLLVRADYTDNFAKREHEKAQARAILESLVIDSCEPLPGMRYERKGNGWILID